MMMMSVILERATDMPRVNTNGWKSAARRSAQQTRSFALSPDDVSKCRQSRCIEADGARKETGHEKPALEVEAARHFGATARVEA
jgi:hypothetical protein